MAWMNQERKSLIAAELKKVMPKDWKYTLGVHHHSTLTLTISAAPVDIIGIRNAMVAEAWTRRGDTFTPDTDYCDVNHYHLEGQFSGKLLTIFESICAALNDGNHDRSDIQTDYFDVGWYVSIHIGRWNKPFVVLPSNPAITERESESKAFVAAPWKPEPIVQRPALRIPASDLANCWRVDIAGNC